MEIEFWNWLAFCLPSFDVHGDDFFTVADGFGARFPVGAGHENATRELWNRDEEEAIARKLRKLSSSVQNVGDIQRAEENSDDNDAIYLDSIEHEELPEFFDAPLPQVGELLATVRTTHARHPGQVGEGAACRTNEFRGKVGIVVSEVVEVLLQI